MTMTLSVAKAIIGQIKKKVAVRAKSGVALVREL